MFELVPGITIFMSEWVFTLLCITLFLIFISPAFGNMKIPEIPEFPRKILAWVIITLFGFATAYLVSLVAMKEFDDLLQSAMAYVSLYFMDALRFVYSH